jgi:hypothetical protein
MKGLKNFLIFFKISSLLAINLEAGEINFPKGCDFKNAANCSIKSIDGPLRLELYNGSLKISSGSVISSTSPDSVYLNNGFYHVRANSNFTIESRFGKIELKANNEIVIEIENENMIVSSLLGDLYYKGVKGPSYLLPAGYSNSLGWPGLSNEDQVGIPRAINIHNLILKFHSKLNYSTPDIKLALNSIKNVLPQAIEERSQRYLASVNESIELQEIEKNKQAKSRAMRILEEKKIRQEFFRKTFLE